MAKKRGRAERRRQQAERGHGRAAPARAAGDAAVIRWLGPAAIALVFIALARWSWRKWPDVIVDFGEQLYLPWQIVEGRVLYTDLAYAQGPLSQYLNALLFRVFGVSLSTLIWSNLAILAGVCALVYRLFTRACDRLTATLVVVVLLAVFGFSQYTRLGNYNYVCPYLNEQTHGLALAIALVASVGEYVRSGALRWIAVAGACLGLAFLTKAELFVPAAGASVVGLGLLTVADPTGRGRSVRLVLTFLAAALAPIVTAAACLTTQMPPAMVLRAVGGNWFHLGTDVVGDPFYLATMGLDDPRGNALRGLWVVLGILAAVAAAGGAAWTAGRSARRGTGLRPALAGLATFAAFAWSGDLVPWRDVGRALPLTSALACAGVAGACLRARRSPAVVVSLLPLSVWAALALLLLGKVLLHVRLTHYGFVLAMPATLLLVACLTFFVPALLGARGGDARLARAVLIAVVLAGVAYYVRWSNALYAWKDLPVGERGDVIIAGNPAYDERGEITAAALAHLREVMPPGATLLALPDGSMLNFWLRRPSPTRYTYLSPPVFRSYGGDGVVLEDLRSHPPDFIALVHRSNEEFGVGDFGDDPRYGLQAMDWVRANYARTFRTGTDRFSIAVFRRNGSAVP